MHRAFHALPPLTNRSGELVNAVYGFTTMLLKIIAELKPQYLAVAFDTAKPTFRKMEYLGYQSKRPAMDEGLAGQFEKVHEVLGAFDVSIFAVPGFEADDVIGTLAFQAMSHTEPHGLKTRKNTEKIEVIIVTGDKDIMQLVGSKVKVYAPVKGLTEMQIFGPKEVEEKLGVKPEQIVDYKGLVGDPSDNYPGIPGIGPKTAVDLLNKYKTFDNLYKHLNELSERVAVKLKEGKELADLSYKLARIVTDVPIKLDLEKAQWQLTAERQEEVIKKLKEFGFKSLVSKLEEKSELESKTKSKSKKEAKDEQLRII